jgi:hypothetical protein
LVLDVVLVEQAPALDPRVRAALPCRSSMLSRDDVTRDAEQPRGRYAALGPVARGRVDCREEHIGGQGGSEVRVIDAPRDELLDCLDVRSIEVLQGRRVVPDARQLVLSVLGRMLPARYVVLSSGA